LPVTDDILRLFGFLPVAIIATVGKDGSVNAAPFSWVAVVSYDPPQVLFSTNIKRHTYKNIIDTKEFVINIPSVDLLRAIWITQKHFPYGVNELKEAGLTVFSAEKVKPPRIKECKAHLECKVIWTKIIGSTCLVLGSIETVSIAKNLEKLGMKERAIALNRPIFFSYQKEGNIRTWMFAEIGKIHTLTELDEIIEIKSETLVK
jgi:flavin reductase (DIM6/NTAB) family NADH-FMN oxidoreductase RutF